MIPAIGPQLRFGTRALPADRAAVMAIINRTPASGHDRGASFAAAGLAAVDRAVDEGADIVDIGGVGAGPGVDLGVAEETRRVVPVIATVRERHPDLLISVDTWRHEVAGAALAAGADIVNGTRSRLDPKLVDVAAGSGCGVVCSHAGGVGPSRGRWFDVVRDVADDLVAQAEKLVALGVPRAAILIDPTRDFGKNSSRYGLELLRHCNELIATGWPVLLTLSAKDLIGEPGTGVADRADGTLAATAIMAWAGVRVFRTHQVRQTRRVLDMVASIAGTRPPSRAVRGLADITSPSAGVDG